MDLTNANYVKVSSRKHNASKWYRVREVKMSFSATPQPRSVTLHNGDVVSVRQITDAK